MEQPVIEFQGYKIKKYNYEKTSIKDNINATEVESDGNEPFGISVEPSLTKDLKNGLITVRVEYNGDGISISITVEGFFKINDNKDSEAIINYLVVNGTAIIFPYIRSMISMLSSLDSENAILLPTLNTNNLI